MCPAASGACALPALCCWETGAPARGWREATPSPTAPESERDSARSWCPPSAGRFSPALTECPASPDRAVRWATPTETAHVSVSVHRNHQTQRKVVHVTPSRQPLDSHTLFSVQMSTSVCSESRVNTSAETLSAASSAGVPLVTSSYLMAGAVKVRVSRNWNWNLLPPLKRPQLRSHPLSLPLDIDECVDQGIQCGHNQMCFNTRGGHQCLDTPCPASYKSGRSPG